MWANTANVAFGRPLRPLDEQFHYSTQEKYRDYRLIVTIARSYSLAICSPEWIDDGPPERTPLGNFPEGVRPFNSRTLSLSFLKPTQK